MLKRIFLPLVGPPVIGTGTNRIPNWFSYGTNLDAIDTLDAVILPFAEVPAHVVSETLTEQFLRGTLREIGPDGLGLVEFVGFRHRILFGRERRFELGDQRCGGFVALCLEFAQLFPEGRPELAHRRHDAFIVSGSGSLYSKRIEFLAQGESLIQTSSLSRLLPAALHRASILRLQIRHGGCDAFPILSSYSALELVFDLREIRPDGRRDCDERDQKESGFMPETLLLRSYLGNAFPFHAGTFNPIDYVSAHGKTPSSINASRSSTHSAWFIPNT